MKKEEFIEVVKEYKEQLLDVKKRSQEVAGDQIQTKKILLEIESLATKWFEVIDVNIQAYSLSSDVLQVFRSRFEKLLELVGGRPSKRVVVTILDSIISLYHTNILVVVQKSQVKVKFPSLDNILTLAKGIEVEYLNESIECARLDKKRAAIILGWCAAVNRLHLCIEKEGFEKFNKASQDLSVIKSGRYKKFNTPYEIHNLTELRTMVPDRNLLWVLEYLGLIDGMQHDRLSICLTMRDTCAHPGETIITDENLPSFFSDIETLIFSNAKFSLVVGD